MGSTQYVTLAIPKDILRKAKILAVQRNTSISGLLTQTLAERVPLEEGYEQARQPVADLAHWRLHVPEASDLLQAIGLHHTYKLSFWDSMVLQSAAHLECRQLLSEDLTHGQTYGDAQVINPFISSN